MSKTENIDNIDFSIQERKELLRRAKEAENPNGNALSKAEVEKLVMEHFDNADKIARKLLRSWQVQLSNDEVKSVVGLAISEAASRFDQSKNVAFTTFLFYYLRGMLIKEISKLAKHNREYIRLDASEQDAPSKAVLEAEIYPDNNPEQVLYRNQLEVFFKEVCNSLDDLEKEIVFRHLIEDQQLNVVAGELGYSRFYTSRVKKRAVAKLQEALRKNPLLLELILNKEV